MINKEIPVPIYFQLEQGIKEQIETNVLKPGDMIPSEREYSETYQISRMTVRQALNNLVNSGYLARERGKGTFVAFRKIEQNLNGLTSFSEEIASRGMEPFTNVIDFTVRKADSPLANKLKIDEDSTVYEIKRIRIADQKPLAYEIMYVSTELVPGLTREIASGSVYGYVEQELGLKIAAGHQEIEAITAKKEVGKLLDLKEDSPLLHIHQVSYLENMIPLEYVESYYRADRYKFIVELKR